MRCVYYDYGDCPTCFFVTELTSHVIAKSQGDPVLDVSAQPGILIAYDFRDAILRHSALGREVVDLLPRTRSPPLKFFAGIPGCFSGHYD